MNRLTKQWGNNPAVPCNFDLDFLLSLDKDTADGLQEFFDRLAAYEDFMDRWHLKSIEDAERIFRRVNDLGGTDLMAQYRELGSINHLRDLLQAEKSGQLVVLPCKVGDVIRFVSEDKQGYTRYEVISFNVDQGETFIVASCKPGSARLFSVSDIGKTAFLTREEAEAALKGDNGHA